MKRLKAILSAAGLVLLALSLPSWAQTRTLPTQTVTLSGTVETIDHARRVVNIKTPDGKFQTIDVPESAKRFDELKVGDKVSITYNNTVSARLKPPGEPMVNTATGVLHRGAGRATWGYRSRGENNDCDDHRYRQERTVDHFHWSEWMEIRTTRRRSDCSRSD